jgi:O-antigen ligase
MMQGLPGAERPKVVVGTAAVALILAATRWGSYIGVSPLFLTDVLLACGILQWIVARSFSGPLARTSLVPRDRPGMLMNLFFAYVVLRAIIALAQNVAISDWIRDTAPFLYASIAFISAASIARASDRARARTLRVLVGALIFHLAWATFSIWTGFLGIPFSDGAAAVFQIRPDIDMAVLGIGAGTFLLAAFRSRRRLLPVVGVVVSLADVFSLQSRAGLISVVASMFVAYLLFYMSTPRKSGRRLFSQMLVPIAVAILLVVLPQTGAGQRLVATINSSSAVTQQQLSAQGTEHARRLVWSQVVSWTNETPSRQLFGSGFGNDFLTQSGTVAFLEGTTYDNVRSPHNYFVGIYARMGTVGLLLAVGVVLSILMTIVRRLRLLATDGVLAMAAMIVVAILPVASLGVVLEAPFGAVPFWWAAGIILAAAPPTRSSATSARNARSRTGQQDAIRPAAQDPLPHTVQPSVATR